MRHESRFCSSVDITAMTRSAEGTPASTCVSMLMPLPSTVMTSSVLPDGVERSRARVDDGDLVTLAEQLLRQRRADLAGSDDNNVHSRKDSCMVNSKMIQLVWRCWGRRDVLRPKPRKFYHSTPQDGMQA